MNETELRNLLKYFSDKVGLPPSNFTMADKPQWFAALLELHCLKGEVIPGGLVDLARRYGRCDSELDMAVKHIEQKKEGKGGGSDKKIAT